MTINGEKLFNRLEILIRRNYYHILNIYRSELEMYRLELYKFNASHWGIVWGIWEELWCWVVKGKILVCVYSAYVKFYRRWFIHCTCALINFDWQVLRKGKGRQGNLRRDLTVVCVQWQVGLKYMMILFILIC